MPYINSDDYCTIDAAMSARQEGIIKDWMQAYDNKMIRGMEHWALRLRELNDARLALQTLRYS